MGITKTLVSFVPVLIVACSGCSTSARPSALVPAKATAPALTSPPTPAAQPVADVTLAAPGPVQSEAKPDAVATLIDSVEKEYQAGQDNYQAGQLAAAKQNFDHAFNMLVSSSLDVHSDERLQSEFDRISDALHGLQVELAQEMNGPAQQAAEPAPIDETNEIAFPVDPAIKAKAEAELRATHSDLPLMLTDPVASYISYFSNRGRGILERGLARGGQYREMIEGILKEEGVPQDLIYLAQAESGFHPLAVSRAGARGMWQFMGSRAKAYGLERDIWVDERQDPEKATRAAARHLKDLYNEFGDWYLAMAAYNSGPGTIQNAVKRTGYADFWELYSRNVLPKETRNYVPIILAVTIMAKNPEQYGLDDVNPEEPVPFESVKIDYAVDLRLVAECVNASLETLQDLNPNLLRFTTPKDRPFELHLPAGSKDRYVEAISAIPPDMRVWWRYHKVAPGDTLVSLARTNHTTRQAIADANDMDVSAELKVGSDVVIPLAPNRQRTYAGAYASRATVYRVHHGDTVETVADNFGVPPVMVRRWNHLRSDSLVGRHVIYVHLPVSARAVELRHIASRKRLYHNGLGGTRAVAVRHKVQPGETLYSIASSYNTTVTALKHDNGNLAILKPGMILLVHGQQ